jgi:2,4-didehydro-3-deoxy-L-rhamnonate hydrolase
MKICRFDDDRLGVVKGDMVHDVTSVLDRLPAMRPPFPRFDPLIARLDEFRPLMEAAAATAPGRPVSGVRLLPPVMNPGKIVAAPVNYKKHLDEVHADAALHHGNQIHAIQRAGLFLKATSSVIGASGTVGVRFPDRRTDHEVELVAIIGKQANKVKAADALSYVAGYCIGLDMTVRGPEERSFRKSIDSYTVFGPWMATADEIPDPTDVDLMIDVNGETRQNANTRDLVLSLAELIEFATAFYTLEPGDLLMTGTPEGVSPVQPGDVMVATIPPIGRMTVPVGEG